MNYVSVEKKKKFKSGTQKSKDKFKMEPRGSTGNMLMLRSKHSFEGLVKATEIMIMTLLMI